MSSRSLVLFEDSYKKKLDYKMMSGNGTFSEDRWRSSNFFNIHFDEPLALGKLYLGWK